MSSLRDIRQRIENIRSTEKIIKAMYMVASAKLQRARAQLEGVRPIYHELKRVVTDISRYKGAETHAFFEKRKVKSSLYVIITSDRGLSGSYNANIMSKALDHMSHGKKEKIFMIGAKGYEYFKKRNKNIIRTVTNITDAHVYYWGERLANWIIDLYMSGEADEVFIAYTHFESVLNYMPYVEQVLPLAINSEEYAYEDDIKYEPDIHAYIDHLIPLYLHMNLFRAFSESHTSEQAARMVNMDSAGKNASKLIEELTHMYNRRRQANITQELSEIVGSANVLSKGESHDS